MKMFSKAGLLAAGAAVLATSMPAQARDRGRDGIDAGDVIAGALIIGGIAAIASAASNNDRYDDRYRDRNDSRYRPVYDNGYGYTQNGYGSRRAVEQCVAAAQRDASRYGGWARITDVTKIDRIRGGYEIKGRLVVEQRGYRGGGYGRGWDRNNRWGNQYDRYGDGYDKGKFSCVTRYGGIQDVRLSGLKYY